MPTIKNKTHALKSLCSVSQRSQEFNNGHSNSGTVRYALLSDMGDKFEVDFETKKRYYIMAWVHDCGQRSWTARCHVIIKVMNVNENMHTPVFSDFIVHSEVAEDSPMNIVVMHMTDPDADNPTAIPCDYMLT